MVVVALYPDGGVGFRDEDFWRHAIVLQGPNRVLASAKLIGAADTGDPAASA